MGKDFNKYIGDCDLENSLINAAKANIYRLEGSIKQEELLSDTAKRNNVSIEEVDDFLCENYKDEKSKEYLVDGAMLTCTRCTKKPVSINGETYKTISNNDRIIKRKDDIAQYENKVLKKLKVTENPAAEISGIKYATIKDCIKEDNIPYFGNCIWPPDNTEEKQRFEKHTRWERKEGSCKYLMNLECEWENYEIGQSFLNFPDDKYGEKTGITMTSVLFCKHGGFIYPVTSGQIIMSYVLKMLEISKNPIALSNTTLESATELTGFTQKKYKIYVKKRG